MFLIKYLNQYDATNLISRKTNKLFWLKKECQQSFILLNFISVSLFMILLFSHEHFKFPNKFLTRLINEPLKNNGNYNDNDEAYSNWYWRCLKLAKSFWGQPFIYVLINPTHEVVVNKENRKRYSSQILHYVGHQKSIEWFWTNT